MVGGAWRCAWIHRALIPVVPSARCLPTELLMRFITSLNFATLQGYNQDKLAEAVRGCDLVIIPAGVPRKPGMTRDDLFKVRRDAEGARDLWAGSWGFWSMGVTRPCVAQPCQAAPMVGPKEPLNSCPVCTDQCRHR